MWLYWWDAGSSAIEVARSNPALTRFGSVCHVPTPQKGATVWSLVGDAGEGPLQLFASAGDSTAQVYDTVVDPCLHIALSRKSVGWPHGGSFTVAVSDAGAPVKGARVSFGGRRKVTDAAGKARFVVARHHKLGRFPVSVAASGYESGSASIKVRA